MEQYLPEMKDVRAQYDLYLKENHLTKTAEEKLFDYLALISEAYKFNKTKMMTEFYMPNIAETLQKDNGNCIYGVIPHLSERMRYHEMQDKAEFSSHVIEEMYKEKEDIEIEPERFWLYKRFPEYKQHNKRIKKDKVRYALNVKPGIGLFKKLDDLCLKYNASTYKVIDKKLYDQRTDPIIIYANKDNQQEMLRDLETLIGPYRRKDEYDTIGYQNLGNGIFMADEVKKEQMTQLKYSVLTKTERDVFEHPVEDEFDQDDREYDIIKNISSNKKSCPAKYAFIAWIINHEFDYSVSNAQYQAAKMVVDAYHKTQENFLLKDHSKQGVR